MISRALPAAGRAFLFFCEETVDRNGNPFIITLSYLSNCSNKITKGELSDE
jgi:hypothetical protein